MKITSSEKMMQVEFEDILEYAEYADKVPSHYYAKADGDNGFAGGSFEDAMQQAKTGNPELVKSLFDGVNILEAMIQEERKGELRDVTGEYFDVGDFLSGEPEVFRRDEYGPQKPVVPVYANFAMNCNTRNSVIKNRGCAIIALCDELVKSGFIVDFNAVDVADYKGRKYYTKIKVRLDPLDIDTAAFILANPLCKRRLWVAAFELYVDNPDPWGHGSPAEYDLQEIFSTGLSGFYFVSSNHAVFNQSNFSSLKNAKKHVLSMIDKFKTSAEQVILG